MNVTIPAAPTQEYVLARVEKDPETGCWLWQLSKYRNGYGQLGVRTPTRRALLAHRVAFELWRGPIPAGLVLDHLCRRRDCVNPAHLDPVTLAENLDRGVGTLSVIAKAKTACPRGHRYTQANTLVTIKASSGRPRRECATCRRLYRGQRRP